MKSLRHSLFVVALACSAVAFHAMNGCAPTAGRGMQNGGDLPEEGASGWNGLEGDEPIGSQNPAEGIEGALHATLETTVDEAQRAALEEALVALREWGSVFDDLLDFDPDDIEALEARVDAAMALAKKTADTLDAVGFTGAAATFRRLAETRQLLLLRGPKGHNLYARDLRDAAKLINQHGFKVRGYGIRVYKTARGIGKGESTRALYRCPISKPAVTYLMTVDSKCDGKGNIAILMGYLLRDRPTEISPLGAFRFHEPTLPNYLVPVGRDGKPPSAPAGWRNEGLLGWLPL